VFTCAGRVPCPPYATERDRRSYKACSVASVLFPHTVLSYQNAAGVRYTPPRRGRTAVRQWTAVIRWR